ncbi:hypothetical protein CXG81DRAFT_11323 [Caulochytrium protostelioides]|uniref:Phospholipid-transporting ATPase n=1 Tax=Caulochytrium protostelioides TaxID=1555241 RepID=A0A4P9WY21_9FUNG|nr:phospholipid-translocating P-type ATPase [Caulochytrium protostelioides]RKP02008.1 hypothetical protein CXG81DRAFT_11323 [Caulochytrium protostelioides]|eukprot:RKP02008.1 hypothetical protein CXG81DRAFT_11323 [Caulochytrium protostelioides]
MRKPRAETTTHLVVPNPSAAHKRDNYIRTTRYTLLSFLPLNLYSQFQRVYNIYFLLGAISTVSGASSLTPVTQIAPLVVVLVISAAKDAFEDFLRYRADREANTAMIDLISSSDGSRPMPPPRAHGSPGLSSGATRAESKLPVDALLLATSHGEEGTAFIDTMELDGETNLKRRTALPATVDLLSWQIMESTFELECEPPNAKLDSFQGRVMFTEVPSGLASKADGDRLVPNQWMPVSENNIALRGCVLRNTEWVIAVAIYTGKNTKIIRNLARASTKKPRMERLLNRIVLLAFLLNILIWLISNARQATNPYDYAVEWYIGPYDTAQGSHLWQQVLSFFAIYTYVIPISLFVTIEVARLFQGRHMTWDRKMMTRMSNEDDGEPTGGETPEQLADDRYYHDVPMRATNTALNEDLGRVDYIFSDKTGTLTQNKMKLAHYAVGHRDFDEMKQPGILGQVSADGRAGPISEQARLFLMALGVCHGVNPSQHPAKPDVFIYESQSPDETALLKGVAADGLRLVTRRRDRLTLVDARPGMDQARYQVQVLASIPFSSDRKRMTVLVKAVPGSPNTFLHPDKYYVFSKGADNIMLALCPGINPQDRKTYQGQLERYSDQGLRTLVVAGKEMNEERANLFLEVWRHAESQFDESRGPLLEQAANILESDLNVLGLTAIEDKLQDRVPDTIAFLIRAGCRFWLLTGDKLGTAINIGRSSRVIEPEASVLVIESGSKDDTLSKLWRLLQGIPSGRPELPPDLHLGGPSAVLVVEGEALGHILSNPMARRLFFELSLFCKSVICCRVSPLQKALVVRLVRECVKGVTTLAIGDGANDVSMIQAAHVGVGIMGREGTQAVRASDYSFAEFRHLARLITVHGRYSSYRFAQLVWFSFYKNIAFITVQFLFGFVSLWSGQTLYEGLFLTCYNILFTSLPPVGIAILEKDVEEEEIGRHPELYRQVARGQYWAWQRGMGAFISAVYHGCLVFAVVRWAMGGSVLSGDGLNVGFWNQAHIYSTSILLTVLLKSLTMTRHWVKITGIMILISIIAHVVIMFIAGPLEYTEPDAAKINYQLANYYFLALIIPLLAILPDIFVLWVYRFFGYPTDAEIMAERRKMLDANKGHTLAPERTVMPAAATGSQPSSSYASMRQRGTADSMAQPYGYPMEMQPVSTPSSASGYAHGHGQHRDPPSVPTYTSTSYSHARNAMGGHGGMSANL